MSYLHDPNSLQYKISVAKAEGEATILTEVENQLLEAVKKEPWAKEFTLYNQYSDDALDYIVQELKERLPKCSVTYDRNTSHAYITVKFNTTATEKC
jgi:hypothetical protein